MPESTTATTLHWVLVAGGTCHYGDAAKPRPVPDLQVAATPLSWAQAGHPSHGDLPVTGIDHAEATDLAAAFGARLPTSVEWEWVAAGPQRRTYPWGDAPWSPARAVLTTKDTQPVGPHRVGQRPEGATPQGVLDLAGNVWEWTASPVMGGGYIIRGGSYASPLLYARTTFLNAVHAGRRSCGISLRLVKLA